MRFSVFLLVFLLLSCKSSLTIIDKPIVFDAQREQLTLDYLRERYGLEQTTPNIVPQMIVLHWTAIEDFEKSFAAFKAPTLPNWRPDIAGVSGLNVSSQFLVDRDGTIYRLLPETTMARHTIGLNHLAIGIENVGGGAEHPLTKKQRKANVRLVNYLAEKYAIRYVIGHYQYTQFEDSDLWLEKSTSYRTHKIDPGPTFLNAVLKKAKKNFLTPPTKHD